MTDFGVFESSLLLDTSLALSQGESAKDSSVSSGTIHILRKHITPLPHPKKNPTLRDQYCSFESKQKLPCSIIFDLLCKK